MPRILPLQLKLDANNKFLSMQLNSLKEHTSLMEENNRKLAVFRHDIRHYNRLLYSLIKEEKTEAALSFITDCDDNIMQTAIKPYCNSPIINAAVAIYVNKAEKEQIPLAHKIELPAVLHLEENELAVLKLANDLNLKYKPFKLYFDGEGSLILDICMIVPDERAEEIGDMVYGMFNVMITFLNENYRTMMKTIW